MVKKSRFVRVTVDLILHMPEESERLPAGLEDVVEGTCKAVADHMNRHFEARGVPRAQGFSDGRVRYAVFQPRRRRLSERREPRAVVQQEAVDGIGVEQ